MGCLFDSNYWARRPCYVPWSSLFHRDYKRSILRRLRPEWRICYAHLRSTGHVGTPSMALFTTEMESMEPTWSKKHSWCVREFVAGLDASFGAD